jgi:hypothetical protein
LITERATTSSAGSGEGRGVSPEALIRGLLLAVGGPIVAFSPPIGIQGVLIVGHALFGAGLAWSGYALWAGRERTSGA